VTSLHEFDEYMMLNLTQVYVLKGLSKVSVCPLITDVTSSISGRVGKGRWIYSQLTELGVLPSWH